MQPVVRRDRQGRVCGRALRVPRLREGTRVTGTDVDVVLLPKVRGERLYVSEGGRHHRLQVLVLRAHVDGTGSRLAVQDGTAGLSGKVLDAKKNVIPLSAYAEIRYGMIQAGMPSW